MISPGLFSETLGRKSLGFFQRLRDTPPTWPSTGRCFQIQ